MQYDLKVFLHGSHLTQHPPYLDLFDQGERFYASSDGDGEHAPGSVQVEGDTARFLSV